MAWAKKTHDGLESWLTEKPTPEEKSWSERISDFLAGVLGWGIEIFANAMSKAFSPKFQPLIDRMEATGQVPPELEPLLAELKNPTGQTGALFASSAGNALVGGAVGKLLDGILLPLAYAVNSATQNVILNEGQYLILWLRGLIDDDTFTKYMSWLGHEPEDTENLKKLALVRLDPQAAITAWRRDPTQFEGMLQDLKDSGISAERVEALKLATEAFPTLSDIVSFYAKEAFEPDMIERYGLEDELPPYEGTLFEKLGASSETARLYWIAHWQHASWNQVLEMLHRGQITKEEVYEYFRVIEIPPYWRDKLINISYNVPTRVDVRRWWDMRTITEERLREVYEHQGYTGKDLEDYVLWTKVYVAFPDLIARFKNGWITEEDVRSQLVGLGMPEDRVEEMIQTKVKPEGAARVVSERDLTLSDIYKGVKKEVITHSQAIDLIKELGFDQWEAEYKLEVNVGALEGSPDTYMELKKWTQLYKKSQGFDVEIPSEELIQAERDVKSAEVALATAKTEETKPKQLAELNETLEVAKQVYYQLRKATNLTQDDQTQPL